MLREKLHQIDDVIFVVKERDDDNEILSWLEEFIEEKNYQIGYEECYQPPPMPSVLFVIFKHLYDALMFKIVFGTFNNV